ncbi:MAG: acetyl esterase/lipase [Granulosicoccus sp.]|jgi:acetyl esterase/lipase
MKKNILILLFISITSFLFSQNEFQPTQPEQGPGSATYLHDEVIQYDFAQTPDGFWLYEPASPRPDSANVIVFNHGYGGYNPMIYGKWIKHLVRKGNIVIFPRYQKNVYSPKPKHFSTNVSQAIRDALKKMESTDFIKPITRNFAMIGHSYGGVITADLAVNFEKHNIPKPVTILLCSPGSGPLKGGILDTYEAMPSDIKMVIMVAEDDRIVGEKFGKKVFKTATNVILRNYIRQLRDNSTNPPHRAGHNESYALDMEFDNGKRNATARRALRKGTTNHIDYYGYWKIFDALLECSQAGENCEYAFGNTPEQRFLGLNSNNQPLLELEVILPESNVKPTVVAQ